MIISDELITRKARYDHWMQRLHRIVEETAEWEAIQATESEYTFRLYAETRLRLAEEAKKEILDALTVADGLYTKQRLVDGVPEVLEKELKCRLELLRTRRIAQ